MTAAPIRGLSRHVLVACQGNAGGGGNGGSNSRAVRRDGHQFQLRSGFVHRPVCGRHDAGQADAVSRSGRTQFFGRDGDSHRGFSRRIVRGFDGPPCRRTGGDSASAGHSARVCAELFRSFAGLCHGAAGHGTGTGINAGPGGAGCSGRRSLLQFRRMPSVRASARRIYTGRGGGARPYGCRLSDHRVEPLPHGTVWRPDALHGRRDGTEASGLYAF